jgi:hypothetical protein
MKMKKPRQYFRVHNNPKDLPERYPANASCHCVPLFGEAVSKLGRGLHLCVVAPLTDSKDRYASAPWMLRVDPDPQHGLDKVSSIDCFQGGPSLRTGLHANWVSCRICCSSKLLSEFC